MARYQQEYKVRDRVTITRGPYEGEKGIIQRVRGLFTKTYDVALLEHSGVVLEKRTTRFLTMTKG